MKRRGVNKKLFTLFLLTVMVATIHLARAFKETIPPDTSSERISNKAKGNPSASFHIKEYSDFQCPACTYASKTLKHFFELYPSEMYVEFRHYPIPKLHPYAITTAVFAECAAKQNKFWPYHDLLFENRVRISRSLRPRGLLIDLAKDVGIEMESFKACVEDQTVEAAVLGEKIVGQRRGVKATPTYFVNGQMVVGARSLEKELKNLLEGEAL